MHRKATFTSASHAAAIMGRLHSAGRVDAWSDLNAFGKTYVRFNRAGRWYDLLVSDLAAWGL